MKENKKVKRPGEITRAFAVLFMVGAVFGALLFYDGNSAVNTIVSQNLPSDDPAQMEGLFDTAEAILGSGIFVLSTFLASTLWAVFFLQRHNYKKKIESPPTLVL